MNTSCVFFCAVTICTSNAHCKFFLNTADVLLKHFLRKYRFLYGEDFMTSNVHNLSHLIDDVRRFGELPSFSAYPFESRLYEIKNLIRNGNRPLAQVAKRLGEITNLEIGAKTSPIKYPILKKQNNNIFKVLQMQDFQLNAEVFADKWFMTDEGLIVQMLYTIKQNGKIIIFGSSLRNLSNFFETPIASSFLKIYISDNISNNAVFYPFECIKCKMVVIPIENNKFVFLPLLHTLK